MQDQDQLIQLYDELALCAIQLMLITTVLIMSTTIYLAFVDTPPEVWGAVTGTAIAMFFIGTYTYRRYTKTKRLVSVLANGQP